MSGKTNCWSSQIDTVAGKFTLTISERGIERLDFPGTPPSLPIVIPPEEPAATALPEAMPANVGLWWNMAEKALHAYFQGGKPSPLPPFDLHAGTPFQQQIWQFLTQIPHGKTRTYGEIATAIGRPYAARAVGQACGANPIPVLIPCHRVLPANGHIGGFSGGLEWKRCLLEIEGISLELH